MNSRVDDLPSERNLLLALLAELQYTRAELAALRELFDAFAGSYLNAKFPYGDGKASDRWRRR